MFKYRNFLEADSAGPTVPGLTKPHNRVGVPRLFAVQTTWRQVGRCWLHLTWKVYGGNNDSQICWASNFPNFFATLFFKKGEKRGQTTKKSQKTHPASSSRSSNLENPAKTPFLFDFQQAFGRWKAQRVCCVFFFKEGNGGGGGGGGEIGLKGMDENIR